MYGLRYGQTDEDQGCAIRKVLASPVLLRKAAETTVFRQSAWFFFKSLLWGQGLCRFEERRSRFRLLLYVIAVSCGRSKTGRCQCFERKHLFATIF